MLKDSGVGYQTRYSAKGPGGFRFSIKLHMWGPVIRGCH
jgi:hypothetical protein